MCITTAAVLAVSTIGSALYGFHEANVQKQESKYRINQLNEQAKNAEREAINARQEGIEEARKAKLDAILNMGRKKTTIAASNLALSSDTSLYLIDDEKTKGDLYALDIGKNAERKSNYYLDAAQDYRQAAGLTSFRAKNNYNRQLFTVGKNLFNSGLSFVRS